MCKTTYNHFLFVRVQGGKKHLFLQNYESGIVVLIPRKTAYKIPKVNS